ncbi:hypothetical protein PG2022B_1694 [Bifidobacterium animalis subsp. animalis]|nr:hypothetical protein PG2022B_1694 [Bifidobacterium animalis subsp. animalis]
MMHRESGSYFHPPRSMFSSEGGFVTKSAADTSYCAIEEFSLTATTMQTR